MTEICRGHQLAEDTVFDLLDGLVRKSLVAETIYEDSSRYRLLESVREYAAEKLAADTESDHLHRRHAEYYLKVANAAKATYYTTPSKEWMLAIEPELENFRSAMHWSLALKKDIHSLIGAGLAGALVLFFAQISTDESLRWLRMALDVLPPDSEPMVEAALWYGVGRASENLPAHQMREAAERALGLARIGDNSQLLGDALRQLILVLGWYYPDEGALAGDLASEAIASARAQGDSVQIALALRSLSVTIDNADVARKQAILEESLTLLLMHGNDLQTAVAFMWLAEYDFCFCGALKASTYAREAMRYADESGSASILAQMATNLAQYTAAEGNWNAARRAAADAAEAAMRLGMDGQVTWAVQALAIACAGTADYVTSARLLGFCDSRVGTLHSQRQANGTEEILYLRLLACLNEHMNAAILAAAMLGGAGLSEMEALQAGFELAGVV
jgi:non-specific serine/threonine protein kinase